MTSAPASPVAYLRRPFPRLPSTASPVMSPGYLAKRPVPILVEFSLRILAAPPLDTLVILVIRLTCPWSPLTLVALHSPHKVLLHGWDRKEEYEQTETGQSI